MGRLRPEEGTGAVQVFLTQTNSEACVPPLLSQQPHRHLLDTYCTRSPSPALWGCLPQCPSQDEPQTLLALVLVTSPGSRHAAVIILSGCVNPSPLESQPTEGPGRGWAGGVCGLTPH